MRISDWSSDVCSSDLLGLQGIAGRHEPPQFAQVQRVDRIQADRTMPAMRGIEAPAEEAGGDHSKLCQSLRLWTKRTMVIPRRSISYSNRNGWSDRKSVVQGKSGSVRVDHGGRG